MPVQKKVTKLWNRLYFAKCDSDPNPQRVSKVSGFFCGNRWRWLIKDAIVCSTYFVIFPLLNFNCGFITAAPLPLSITPKQSWIHLSAATLSMVRRMCGYVSKTVWKWFTCISNQISSSEIQSTKKTPSHIDVSLCCYIFNFYKWIGWDMGYLWVGWGIEHQYSANNF